MATKVEEKFTALGLAPPGDGKDLERVWSETVQNLIRQHRGSLQRAADPYLAKDQKQAADDSASHYSAMIKKVSAEDLAAAVEAIEHAESQPQHTLTVGEEAP